MNHFDYSICERGADAQDDIAPWGKVGYFQATAIESVSSREELHEYVAAYLAHLGLEPYDWNERFTNRIWEARK